MNSISKKLLKILAAFFFLSLSTKSLAENRNVLITGGAGYIGSQTCKALFEAGYTPISYDNLSNGHKELVKWGPLEIGDIADREALRAAISKYHPIAVIHFAALKSVEDSIKDPASYYFNNLYGTLVLLDTLKDNGIDKIIFSSTAAVYGIPETHLVTESNLVQPINPYGHTKAMTEQILKDFEKAYGLRFISLRYFNAAGADPGQEIGELGAYPKNLIPYALRILAKADGRLAIFGTDFDTPDGTAVRDYIHVADLADAHVKALEHLQSGKPSMILNLGTGKGFSVREVVETAERILQRPLQTVLAPRREGDPPCIVADASKAQELLNWRPRYSDLQTIIATEWQWLCKSNQTTYEENLASR